MVTDFLILALSLFATILILNEHEKKRITDKKTIAASHVQNQKAPNHPYLRKLYLEVLKDKKRYELHQWLNKTNGDIRLGHIYLVRQYVLFQKPLPYPVPTFGHFELWMENK